MRLQEVLLVKWWSQWKWPIWQVEHPLGRKLTTQWQHQCFFFSFHSLAIAAHHSFFKNEPLNCLHKSCTYRAVSNIDSVREPASRHQSQNMKRNQVDQENISAPGGNLIKGKVTKLCMHYYFASFKAERYWVSWCFFQVVWSNKVSN